MSRGPALLLAFALSLSAQQAPAPTPPAANDENLPLPPEEDKLEAPKEYSFNPLQSKKEVTVGEFYLKKGDARAAAIRFREATKWDDGNSMAWLRLGETLEKNHDLAGARDAYQKYVQLAPDAKNTADIKKHLEKLPASR